MSKFVSLNDIKQFWDGLHTHLRPTVLYQNALVYQVDHTQEASLPITLSQSCLNFSRLVIECQVNDGSQGYFVTKDVLHPVAGKKFDFNEVIFDNSTYSWHKFFVCQISNDGLSIEKGGYIGERYVTDSTSGYYANNLFRITRVLGYK